MITRPCRRSAVVTIATFLTLAPVGCEKKPESLSAAPRPELSAAKPVPAAAPAQPAVAKAGSPAADAGVVAAKRPLTVRPGARPECKEPAPILSARGSSWFSYRNRRRLPMPLTWGVVWYLRGPDGKETLPQAEGRDVGLPRGSDVLDSNYFAGRLPNRTAGVLAGGPARLVAVNERWLHQADGFETVWLGALSPVAANDETLLFSIKLSDRAAVQALVEREQKITDFSVEYFGEGDPVMPKEMRPPAAAGIGGRARISG